METAKSQSATWMKKFKMEIQNKTAILSGKAPRRGMAHRLQNPETPKDGKGLVGLPMREYRNT